MYIYIYVVYIYIYVHTYIHTYMHIYVTGVTQRGRGARETLPNSRRKGSGNLGVDPSRYVFLRDRDQFKFPRTNGSARVSCASAFLSRSLSLSLSGGGGGSGSGWSTSAIEAALFVRVTSLMPSATCSSARMFNTNTCIV